jgi:hypothetical protein
MLNAALYARNSEHAGEKWYELRVGDKRIDTRPFAPFSTYLFMAEAMSNPDNIKPADYASALLSLNRIAGTGLVLTDMMRGKKFETFMNSAVRFAGEYLGGFSVPARTFKDIYSAVNPEEAKIRDIRDSELTGPTARNIPVLSQTLPETESPMKEENPRTENPLLRQFTGLSVSTKTSLEQEINKLNADTGKLYPKTGIPEADREVSKIMGPVMEKIGPLVMKSEGYQNASDPIKRFIMYELFKRVRQGAMKQLPADMVAAIRMKRISPDIKDIMEEGISQ